MDSPNRGFLELAKDFGEPCEAGLRLNLRLTHQEIASALSTTRVTVTRVLGQLRDEGWLQIDASRHLMVTGAGRAAEGKKRAGENAGSIPEVLMFRWGNKTVESERRDLNPRPPLPQSGALPSCATPRQI